MKKILSITVEDNQSKGEISLGVFRGHASVQLVIDSYEHSGKPASINVYLRTDDATHLANALKTAASEVQESKLSTS